MSRPARWFHGGRPGIRPGHRILPPDVTGTLTAAQMLQAMGIDLGIEDDRSRTDLVYLTSAVDLARAYAGSWQLTGRGPHGTLYQVAPGPDAAPDPDFEEDFPGLCVQASHAEVVRVVQVRIVLDRREFQLTMLKYTTWIPGPCPRCGHDAQTAKPGCRCTGCICEAVRLDPTAAQRVRPGTATRPQEGFSR